MDKDQVNALKNTDVPPRVWGESAGSLLPREGVAGSRDRSPHRDAPCRGSGPRLRCSPKPPRTRKNQRTWRLHPTIAPHIGVPNVLEGPNLVFVQPVAAVAVEAHPLPHRLADAVGDQLMCCLELPSCARCCQNPCATPRSSGCRVVGLVVLIGFASSAPAVIQTGLECGWHNMLRAAPPPPPRHWKDILNSNLYSADLLWAESSL